MNPKKLQQGEFSSLNNKLWTDSDNMAIALIINSNPYSVSVMIAHAEPSLASEDDLILSSKDSGLTFDLVVMKEQTYSLPYIAFGDKCMMANKKCLDHILGEKGIKLSEFSGQGRDFSENSKENNWRKKLLKGFSGFRRATWRNYFFQLLKSYAKNDFEEELLQLQPHIYPGKQSGQVRLTNPLKSKSSKIYRPPEEGWGIKKIIKAVARKLKIKLDLKSETNESDLLEKLCNFIED
jgi:hypothetical protein